ncbi:Major facilitator superfamily domain, general substrate transporter [Penicillium griseofulvum]|uniref:Major facilitator superfamily domain, general substrate transporter n=1 Tax=Penicillium patulum TaxID=5078 RepID=A0A135L8P0_PENPA|nr:Major facilitator superfamily domain, general substrate transporter [Penicillium griseofulvum]KXG45313.1 Major facilitator superfamily domain, general substrate transporter [Penicillium griseofulvum]
MSWLLKKIVHNEAMREDPKEIYGWRVFMLACSACFGGMLFGMDTGIISGVLTMPGFKKTYQLENIDKVAAANLSANIVSTLQAGCFFGAMGASPVAERYGRRMALLGSAVVAVLGILMQTTASGHIEVMYIGRLITGFGVGAASMINPLYVSENAPRAIRGGLTGLYQLFITAGIMLAFWINYGSLLHIKGPAMYLVPLALQGLPAVLLFFGMLMCNESPRWLAKQDRWEEARATLSKVRNLPSDHPYVEEEFQAIATQLEQERALVAGSGFWDLMKEMWFIPGNRKRAIISVVLMICQQMTGTNAINYYAPQIFQNLGVTGNATNLFATGVYGIVKMVSCGVFLIFVADSLGRRRSLLWTSVAQALAMMYIGLYVRIAPPVKGEPVIPAGYFALVCIFLFAAFFQFGWGPVCWIYVSEIPTARLRSLNVSFGAATQWLFNFVVARAVPNMLATVGANGYGTYIIFSCFCFSMGIFVWFFIPETKGLSLEKMDELFGVTQMLENKNADAERGSVGDRGEKSSPVHVEKVNE